MQGKKFSKKELKEMEPGYRWFVWVLNKLPYHIDLPLLHYKNILTTVWIICFNPLMIVAYISFGAVFAMMYFD